MALGFVLALLILTKAIFYYFLYVLAFILFIWWISNGLKLKKALKRVLIIFLSVFMLIGPWMIRNFYHFDRFEIAGGRSGTNILARAYLDELNYEEYHAFVLLNLPKIRWVNSQLDEYLYPELYQKLRWVSDTSGKVLVRRSEIIKRIGSKNNDDNEILLDEGKKIISSNTKNHFAMILPVFLRGSLGINKGFGYFVGNEETIGLKKFNISVHNFKYKTNNLVNIAMIMIFILTFVITYLIRKWSLFMFMLPTVYCFTIYSFFTVGVSRFFFPLIPIIIIVDSIVIYCFLNLLFSNLRLFVKYLLNKMAYTPCNS